MRVRIAPLIAAALLGACGAPIATPTHTITPEPATATTAATPSSTPYDLSFIGALSPDTTLLQLEDVAGEFPWDVPIFDFTMYSNGNVIYVDTSDENALRVMQSQIDREDIEDLMRLVLTARLEYISEQMTEEVCPTEEGPWLVSLRILTATGYVLESPDCYPPGEDFQAIVRRLADYDDADAIQYDPDFYCLEYGEHYDAEMELISWPLDPELLHESDRIAGITIVSAEAGVLVDLLGTNMGYIDIENQGEYYRAWLSPILIGGQSVSMYYEGCR